MRQPRKQPNRSGWERVSRWYGDHLKDEESLLNTVVYPAALKELGDVAGKKLLDIACGEGAFSRLAAANGAAVTGFDASPSLIERARRLAPTKARYLVADAEGFYPLFKNDKFDAAVCLLALQNIRHFERTVRNASGVLKPGAPFVIVLNHPAFRVPRQSSWGWEPERKIQYRRIDMYMSELNVPIVAHPGEKRSAKTFSYHRPLSAFVNALGKNGFAVTGMEELVSNRVSDPGPRAKAEDRVRAEIPMFLLIKAVKK